MNRTTRLAPLALTLLVAAACTAGADRSAPQPPTSGAASDVAAAPSGEEPVDPVAGPVCALGETPAGALPDQPGPVFCSIEEDGADTAVSRGNSWVDEFDHGQSFASLVDRSYRVFDDVGFVHDTVHWRHADHWMVDVATNPPGKPQGWVRGGAMMRPDRSFRFEDGMLVVEADAAAAVDDYGANAWPELVVTTGAEPTDVGSLYAYDDFPEDWTLGCRLQGSRYPVCALKSDTGDVEERRPASRPWEMSAHQLVGDAHFGGALYVEGLQRLWRVCAGTDPDIACRDRFRLELESDRVGLYVNGERYFEQTGPSLVPEELLTGDVYVYFASMVVSHPAEVVRFHWDRLAVNPGSPPTPAPGFET